MKERPSNTKPEKRARIKKTAHEQERSPVIPCLSQQELCEIAKGVVNQFARSKWQTYDSVSLLTAHIPFLSDYDTQRLANILGASLGMTEEIGTARIKISEQEGLDGKAYPVVYLISDGNNTSLMEAITKQLQSDTESYREIIDYIRMYGSPFPQMEYDESVPGTDYSKPKLEKGREKPEQLPSLTIRELAGAANNALLQFSKHTDWKKEIIRLPEELGGTRHALTLEAIVPAKCAGSLPSLTSLMMRVLERENISDAEIPVQIASFQRPGVDGMVLKLVHPIHRLNEAKLLLADLTERAPHLRFTLTALASQGVEATAGKWDRAH